MAWAKNSGVERAGGVDPTVSRGMFHPFRHHPDGNHPALVGTGESAIRAEAPASFGQNHHGSSHR